jgi:hypothetical protein
VEAPWGVVGHFLGGNRVVGGRMVTLDMTTRDGRGHEYVVMARCGSTNGNPLIVDKRGVLATCATMWTKFGVANDLK